MVYAGIDEVSSRALGKPFWVVVVRDGRYVYKDSFDDEPEAIKKQKEVGGVVVYNRDHRKERSNECVDACMRGNPH